MLPHSRFGRLPASTAAVVCLLGGLALPAWSADFSAKQRVAPAGVSVAPQVQAALRPAASKVRLAPLAVAASVAQPLAATPAAALAPVAAPTEPPLAAAPAPLPTHVLVADSLPPSAPSASVAVAPEPHAATPWRLSHSEPPALNSSVALVMDQHTQQVLLRKNDTAVVPIASLTKLMTGLIVADARLDMDERIRITQDDVDRLKNSGSRLAVGAVLTREEALHLALMSSENRAAHALARTFPGGEARFVRLMNAKAAELGMRDTHFVDPTGLSSLNRSSARDLVRLASVATERPMLRNLSTSPSYDMAMGKRVVQYRNSNRLVLRDDWDIGLQKTGYIREAGRCLLMQVNVAGRQLIMVLLDAAAPSQRMGDAERVRRWAESLIDEVGGSDDSPLSVKRRPSV
jgi:serine-type D-Ala-D-Ala endopeptidase (penicillin-binding protein 7)